MYVNTGTYPDPNGQQMSQILSLLGSVGGGFLPFPGGSLLGGAAGGILGGLFGGGNKQKKQQIFPVGTKENPGWIPTSGGASQVFQPGGQIGDQSQSAGVSAGLGGLQGLGIGNQVSNATSGGTDSLMNQLGALMRKYQLFGGGDQGGQGNGLKIGNTPGLGLPIQNSQQQFMNPTLF